MLASAHVLTGLFRRYLLLLQELSIEKPYDNDTDDHDDCDCDRASDTLFHDFAPLGDVEWEQTNGRPLSCSPTRFSGGQKAVLRFGLFAEWLLPLPVASIEVVGDTCIAEELDMSIGVADLPTGRMA